MDSKNLIVRVAMYNTSQPVPKHDFTKLENTEYSKTHGIVAASQTQLNEQIKSRLRLEPTAKEIRYFYYEVLDE